MAQLYHTPPPFDILQATQKEIITAIELGQHIQLFGAPGSGKTTLLKAVAANFPQHPLTFNVIDCTDSHQFSIDHLQDLFTRLLTDTTSRHIIELDGFYNSSSLTNTQLLNWLYQQHLHHRGQIIYIFSTTIPLISKSQLSQFGDLGLLICERLVKVPPLTLKESAYVFDIVSQQSGQKYTPERQKQLYDLSGGNFQTLKRLAECQGDINHPRMQFHLARFYQQLSQMNDNPQLLQAIGVQDPKQKWTIPVLATYLETYTPIQKSYFEESLTPKEYQVYSLLKSQFSQLFERDDLIRSIWGEDGATEISDHALNQIIMRLKKKLAESGLSESLQTLRGRGIKLTSKT